MIGVRKKHGSGEDTHALYQFYIRFVLYGYNKSHFTQRVWNKVVTMLVILRLNQNRAVSATKRITVASHESKGVSNTNNLAVCSTAGSNLLEKYHFGYVNPKDEFIVFLIQWFNVIDQQH